MPISNEALEKEANHFIAVEGEGKVGQAFAAFNALGAQPWWHLVVRLPEGNWGVTMFRDLSGLSVVKGDEAAEVYLRDLGELTIASAVERDSIETKAAQAQARQSRSGVLIVTVGGIPVGILVGRANRSGLVRQTSIEQLGGKYVKLKDYGTILLGSSKK